MVNQVEEPLKRNRPGAPIEKAMDETFIDVKMMDTEAATNPGVTTKRTDKIYSPGKNFSMT